jgi:hypothetical protein
MALLFYIRPRLTFPAVPTVAQVQRTSMVIAVLAAVANTDTQVQFTHSFQVPETDQTQGLPLIFPFPADPSAFVANWYTTSQFPNYATLWKSNTTQGGLASGGQLLLVAARPNTLFR